MLMTNRGAENKEEIESCCIKDSICKRVLIAQKDGEKIARNR